MSSTKLPSSEYNDSRSDSTPPKGRTAHCPDSKALRRFLTAPAGRESPVAGVKTRIARNLANLNVPR
jgi:hypothetical protein